MKGKNPGAQVVQDIGKRDRSLVMLDRDDLDKLARALVGTREREIDCDECFEQMDPFAETEFLGSDAAAAMPLVRDHLRNCADCRQNYEALLIALRVR